MTAQERPEHDKSATEHDDENKVVPEQARAEAKDTPNDARGKERGRSKAKKALRESHEALDVAHAKIEHERHARLEAEKALAEAQQNLAVTKAKVEQERQARIKAERALIEAHENLAAAPSSVEHAHQVPIGAERVLAEASEATTTETESVEMPLTEGVAPRTSFVVRLTLDELGQPRRTEVEHVQSGKKENFPALDGPRLVAFMKATLPKSLAAPMREQRKPAAHVTVYDVQVFQTAAPGLMTLTLNSDEASVVQARFRLQWTEPPSHAAQHSSYQIKVYANEVTSGTSRLLTSYRANLVKDVLEYTAQMQAPRLSPGLYRLLTMVTIYAPVKAAGHYEGPVIQVVGV